MGVQVSRCACGHTRGVGGQFGVWGVALTVHPLPPQTLLDMVENYPTALRSLVLAENSISPELQQQICDLLSEGEEEEEVAGGAGDTQERERGREPAAHQRSSSSWMCPSGKSPGADRSRVWKRRGTRDGGCGHLGPLSPLCPCPSAPPQIPALRWCS